MRTGEPRRTAARLTGYEPVVDAASCCFGVTGEAARLGPGEVAAAPARPLRRWFTADGRWQMRQTFLWSTREVAEAEQKSLQEIEAPLD